MVSVAPIKRPQLVEITPEGEVQLHFHEGQSLTWESKARFIAMLAGTQGGKTSFAPWWLNREINAAFELMRSMGQDLSKGLGDFLAVTSTYDLFKLAMLPALRNLFEDILHIGHYWAGDRIMELSENLVPYGKFWARDVGSKDAPMFGRIILRSAEAESGLEAATIKAAWLDEVGQPEFTLGAWEAVLRRLAINQGRALLTTTIYNLGWLKQEVYDKWMAGDSNFDVIQYDSTTNPGFPREEFERARSAMPTWKFNMFYRGLFTRPEGMVYSSFDEQACVIEPFTIPEDWQMLVGHDFGSNNPAQLIYAYDPGMGLFYLVQELKPGGMSVQGQVSQLKRVTKGHYVLMRRGGSHQEVGERGNYTQQGWPIAEPTVRSVTVGIERVFALHRRNAIMVFNTCKGYLNEKLSYSYKLAPGYGATDEIENKSRYHYMDAERYILSGFFDRVGSRMPNQKHSGNFGGDKSEDKRRPRRFGESKYVRRGVLI